MCYTGWKQCVQTASRGPDVSLKKNSGKYLSPCWVHQQLGRTPAMAAGLTHHTWSVKEVLCYKVAPAPCRPSRYLSILHRLHRRGEQRYHKGQAHPPVNVAIPNSWSGFQPNAKENASRLQDLPCGKLFERKTEITRLEAVSSSHGSDQPVYGTGASG